MKQIKYTMSIVNKGKYIDLDGSINRISEEMIIRLNLNIDFNEGRNDNLDIERVYVIPNSGRSYLTLKNSNNYKQLMLSPVYLDDAAIINKGNAIFYVKVNPYQLNFISENLLTSDLIVNWNIEWYGVIRYVDKKEMPIERITISNNIYTDTKLSQNEFSTNVWNKITSEKRYLINMPDLNTDIFVKAKNSFDDTALKEWSEMMQDRTSELKNTMHKYEYADNKGGFISIARDIKAILDKLKFNTESTNNNQKYLEGLLFNNLFSGAGANRASEGMMQGIMQIFTGLTRISNQIGHLATEDAKYYSFSGDKDTIMTFLFITDLLFNYIGKRLEN